MGGRREEAGKGADELKQGRREGDDVGAGGRDRATGAAPQTSTGTHRRSSGGGGARGEGMSVHGPNEVEEMGDQGGEAANQRRNDMGGEGEGARLRPRAQTNQGECASGTPFIDD